MSRNLIWTHINRIEGIHMHSISDTWKQNHILTDLVNKDFVVDQTRQTNRL